MKKHGKLNGSANTVDIRWRLIYERNRSNNSIYIYICILVRSILFLFINTSRCNMKVIFELGTQYGMAGNTFAVADILYYEGKTYQINMYPIEVE